MKNLATYLSLPTGEITINLATPTSALAIGAHPDDIEFGCGGTLAKWAAAGCKVSTLILTDGSKGSWIGQTDPVALARLRVEEAQDAASVLTHSADVRFLGAIDGELQHGPAVVKEVARTIREIQPSVLLGHDPWKRYRLHPDHREAGWITTDAIVAARDPLFLRDLGLPPHRPDALLLWEADTIDHYESIDDTIDLKYQALLRHGSQLSTTMGIDDPTNVPQCSDFLDRLRTTHQRIGATIGQGLCEDFKIIDDL